MIERLRGVRFRLNKFGYTMISQYSKALAQLGDPPIRRAVIKTALFSIAAITILWIVGGFGFTAISWDWIGLDWLRDAVVWVASAGAFIAGLIVTVLLFPTLMTAIVGIFMDEIVDAVEARHYPGLPAPRHQPMAEAVFSAIKFMAVSVVAISIALVVSLLMGLSVILLPLTPLILWGVNGYLVGREYFETVAVRRHEPEEAKALRKRHSSKVLVTGVIGAALLTIPLVNLIAPVIAAAAMTHRYHGVRAKQE